MKNQDRLRNPLHRPEKFRYYVPYSFLYDGQLHNGARELSTDGPMEDAEVRRDVEKRLRTEYLGAVILNWKRID